MKDTYRDAYIKTLRSLLTIIEASASTQTADSAQVQLVHGPVKSYLHNLLMTML
jgi:hypothetical protein